VSADHTTSTVSLDVRAGVAHVILRRGGNGNAIDLFMARSLHQVAAACATDDRVRVVLLSAEGSSFCVGGDLSEFAAVGADRRREHVRAVADELHAALLLFSAADAPVVAAVHGSVAGAGASLAVFADVTLASADASFVLGYTGVGYSPDGGATWTLPRLVGYKRALELLLLNPRLSAAEAHDLGLVTTVVEPEQLLERALDLAQRLASGPVRALGVTRYLVNAATTAELEAHLAREAEAVAAAAGSAEGLEGVTAFLEKRPPRFAL
jgi:2-(1,2-epoxy-1,2-dihydrophenyl)acetyl-CoA isomerase